MKTSAKRRKGRSESSAQIWGMRESNGVQIIEVLPFKKFGWLRHSFSTRPGGASVAPKKPGQGQSKKVLNLGYTDWDARKTVEENRAKFAAAFGASAMQLVTLKQIHSDIVHFAPDSSPQILSGDALVTRMPGKLIAIQTADCIPILLVDSEHRAVAAVHAGWRGTLARIAVKTAGRMQMEFGTRQGDLLAALGPGIGACCYEIGPEVVRDFTARFASAHDWFDGPFDQLASGEDPSPLPWLTMMPPGHEPPPLRCRLNLRAANRAILIEAGLKPENIFAIDLCTACRTDLFFSYRREGATGRMLSAIGIK